MGKGARIREQRRQEQARRDAEPDIQTLVAAVEPIASPAEFEALVRRRPSLFGQPMLDYLHELASDPNIEPLVTLFRRLVESAPSEPEAAWLAFRDSMDDAEQRGRALEPVLTELERLIGEASYDNAIELGEEGLTQARQLGFGLVVGEIHAHLANAFRLRVTGDAGDNIDAAIEHTQGALAVAVDAAHRVSLQMNLTVLVASRKNGDPAENSEHGIEVLRDALNQLDDAAPGDLRAIVQTNLARTLQVRERGDRMSNLLEARDLCLAALEWRSLDRDPEDWAYTKINLGAITADLAALGQADPVEAERLLIEVIGAADEVGIPRLIGAAHGSLSGLHRNAAERIATDEDRVVIGPGKPPPPGEAETQQLDAAREHADAALRLLDPESDRDLAGRALDDLGAVQEALGDEDGAIEAYSRAVGVLRPRSAPGECRHAGGRLGELFARRGDWAESAAAYAMAVSAGEFGFHARLETADRATEIQRTGNLPRWAAFALAKTGETDAAALVLENGRTRELRRRLARKSDEAAVAQLPSEARVDYLRALADISVASLGRDSDAAGRRLQEVLTAIRALPGFAGFAKGVGWGHIVAAIEPDTPLVYVNPTPFGTLLLTIAPTTDGVSSAAAFLDSPTSHDVLMALMLGDMSDLSQPSSYLAGASGGAEEQRRFRRGLGHVLAVVGEWIARPLADSLADLDATGATIVGCGPISQAPLHAASWSAPDGETCLLDLFDVRFAPSATLHAACLRRARERASRIPKLGALGNPDLRDPRDDLPAAEAEVEEIARHFDPGQVVRATRKDATSAFLVASAPEATHVHLACHGKGGLLDPEEAGIALADRWVSAFELAGLALKARLTVLSACETAVAEIARLPDEALSLSTAFLAAGSAGSVATFWSIDDAAAALLMIRLYEELFSGAQPAQALRRAQLWLRDLSDADEAAFLAAHPALEKEFQRRAAQGRMPGTRSKPGLGSVVPDARPYSAPEFWAAFAAAGA